MTTEVMMIELTKLQESKTNPRTSTDKNRLNELAQSIKEKGVLLPLIVRTMNGSGIHEIVSGARRYRAAKIAGLKEVPCIPRTLSDEDALEIQLIENLQREDVHPLQEADGYKRLREQYGYSIDQLAAKVSKSPAYVQQRLQYVNLIEPVRKMFVAGDVGLTQALLVARLLPEQQKVCVSWLREIPSVASLTESIKRQFFLLLKDAPFDPKDAKLDAKAGSCTACPKRTGFNKLLFPDIKEADTCTDPGCFENKTKAFIKIQVGTHPDAVLLTVDSLYSTSEKPKGEIHWVKAGDKHCPDVKQGVVVEILGHYQNEKQKAKLGAVLICANPKCKTHGEKAAPRSDYDAQSGHSRKAMKVRKVELRRRALVFKELASDQFDVKEVDYRAILDWHIRQLSSDNCKALCNAMGWEPKPAQFGGKNYGGAIVQHLAKLTAEGVEQWLYLLMLADKELWFYNGSTPKAVLLEAKAKTAGVPLAECAKQAKAKQSKAQEKKAS